MRKVLFIQTAFIGDAILATAMIEKWAKRFPHDEIHFLVKKGVEGLFEDSPVIDKVWTFDKKKKWSDILRLTKSFRNENFDFLINAQRFFSSGLISSFAGAKMTIGFDKNPLSFLYSKKISHTIDVDKPSHEIYRNQKLIEEFTGGEALKPKLHPRPNHFKKVPTFEEFVCMAPSSVWFTKKLPESKWVELINKIPTTTKVVLMGGPGDKSLCESIKSKSDRGNITNKAGELSFLESTAYISWAKMTYVNDSAPLHMASAVNAPVTAFFCSTVPEFGFGPLSDESIILQHAEKLSCRPCGLHGKKSCPEGHFKCGEIEIYTTQSV